MINRFQVKVGGRELNQIDVALQGSWQIIGLTNYKRHLEPMKRHKFQKFRDFPGSFAYSDPTLSSMTWAMEQHIEEAFSLLRKVFLNLGGNSLKY